MGGVGETTSSVGVFKLSGVLSSHHFDSHIDVPPQSSPFSWGVSANWGRDGLIVRDLEFVPR